MSYEIKCTCPYCLNPYKLWLQPPRGGLNQVNELLSQMQFLCVKPKGCGMHFLIVMKLVKTQARPTQVGLNWQVQEIEAARDAYDIVYAPETPNV